MKMKTTLAVHSLVLGAAFTLPASGAQLDRTDLPIPELKLEPIREIDIRKTRPPPRFEVKAPQGAPGLRGEPLKSRLRFAV